MLINTIFFNNFNNRKMNDAKSVKNDSGMLPAAKEYNPISYPAAYYINNLSFKGDIFKKELRYHLRNSSQDELFLFLDTELRKKAAEQRINVQVVDDMVQNTIMDIYLLLNVDNQNCQTQEELVEKINEMYESLKAKKKDYPNEYGVRSIYEEFGYDEDYHHLSIIDITPDDEDHKLIPLSMPDELTIEQQKQQVATALENTQLDERSESLLKGRYLQNPPVKYKLLTEQHNICEQTAMLLVKRAIIKAQIANNSLPEKTKQQIIDISKTFNTNYASAQNMVIINPYLLNHSQEEFQSKISSMVKAFKDKGLSTEKYIACCIRHPVLMNKGPKAMEENIGEIVKSFKEYGLNPEDYIAVCCKQPHLFYQSPILLKNNINGVAKKFKDNGLTPAAYFNACMRNPALFCSSPERVEKNIKGTVKEFEKNGLTVEKYIKAACKAPSLFCTPSKTVANNVYEVVKRFKENDLTVNKYIKACIRKAPLFYQSPDTIERNIRGTVKKFEENGLTVNDYIKAACRAATLFSMLPDTVEKNVKTFVQEYRDNDVTTDKYINACKKRPFLFYSSVGSINQRIRGILDAFKDNGLTKDDYIKCCLKQPPLLGLTKEKIINNVNGVVDRYKEKGLTLEDYLKTCCKAPSLFQNCPNTVAEHIDIQRFSLYNTKDNYSDEEAIREITSNGIELSYSSKLLLIKHLIIPKMYESNSNFAITIRGGHLEEKLEKYLKDNPEKTYDICLKNFETGTDCISILDKCLKEISQKATGKDNVFNIVLNGIQDTAV